MLGSGQERAGRPGGGGGSQGDARAWGFLLSVTCACGPVVAVAHVLNRAFVAPAYDVALNLTSFASATAASLLLGHSTPALLSAVAIACWLLLARRTVLARRGITP